MLEKANVFVVLSPLKLQAAGVGSKPFPVTVPLPLRTSPVVVWETMTLPAKLKVNPPPVQSPATAVDGLKVKSL